MPDTKNQLLDIALESVELHRIFSKLAATYTILKFFLNHYLQNDF